MKKIFLALFFVGFGVLFAHAQTVQTTDDEDIQSWNDVQLTVPVTKEFDFYGAVTARFGKNITHLNDR